MDRPASMIPTALGFPSTAGTGTYAVSGMCVWWGLAGGVAVVAGRGGLREGILRGIFPPMTPLW